MIKLQQIVCVLISFVTCDGYAQKIFSYSTDFNDTESPISENSAWKKSGLDWTNVVTSDGLAYGTQTGFDGFNDSYSYLAGTFSADQGVSVTIHLESGITADFAEVEILLRWRDSDHFSTGYECNLAYNGQYAEIIKWPGPFTTDLNAFQWVSKGNAVSGGVHDGDVFSATAIGNVITVWLNGNVIASGTDNTFSSGGAPGIGFYAEGAAASKKYAFSQFSYRDMSVLSIVTSAEDNGEENSLADVSVYPNPFQRTATVELKKYVASNNSVSKKTELLLFDLLGREVFKTEINNRQTEIDRGNLPDGIYFYKVTDQTKIMSGKITIN